MLLSPITLGPISLSNRIVISPMCQYSADDGSMNDWHLQHAMQMAMSGAGMFVVEATATERRGRITKHCVGLYSDNNENAMRRVLNAARSVATNDLKFAIQIGHAGRKASHQVPWKGGRALSKEEDAWTTSAPSAIPFTQGSHIPEALDKAGMQSVKQNFVEAAKRAKTSKFKQEATRQTAVYSNASVFKAIGLIEEVSQGNSPRISAPKNT